MNVFKVLRVFAILAVVAVLVPTGSASPNRQAAPAFTHVEPGQYMGRTSQGQQVLFNVVAGDPDYIDSWSFGFNLKCKKSGRQTGVGMGFGGFHVDIDPNTHMFTFDFLSLQFFFKWGGKFDSPSSAFGLATTRWAAMVDSRRVEACDSGNVSWTATHSGADSRNPENFDHYYQVTKDANGKVRVQQIK
jgi:hypothetical protein